MTNYEKIKNMNVEEMAEMFCNVGAGCNFCKHREGLYCNGLRIKNCQRDSVKEWLNKEISETK